MPIKGRRGHEDAAIRTVHAAHFFMQPPSSTLHPPPCSVRIPIMRPLNVLIGLIIIAATSLDPSAQGPGGGLVLFEGARLIVGDGTPPVENAAFIVENGQFTRVGRKGE